MADSMMYKQVESRVSDGRFWAFNENELDDLIVREDHSALVYDLKERTSIFGERIVLFAKRIPCTAVNSRLISQLVGAGTSIGANYCEADNGVSRPDFKNRIGTCRKEAREAKFFLRMIAVSEPNLKAEARDLWKEADSLHRIFSRIWRSTNT